MSILSARSFVLSLTSLAGFVSVATGGCIGVNERLGAGGASSGGFSGRAADTAGAATEDPLATPTLGGAGGTAQDEERAAGGTAQDQESAAGFGGMTGVNTGGTGATESDDATGGALDLAGAPGGAAGAGPLEPVPAPEPISLPLTGALGAHDPAIIAADGAYHLFSTGAGIPRKISADLAHWQNLPSVFARAPEWIEATIPGAEGIWAPDISAFGGKYHLYYSVSTFGSPRSCIGHATAELGVSLSSTRFVDQGPVLCSTEQDNFNAIDPNAIVDENGRAWLAFGSFWSGIKLIPLTREGARAGTAVHSIAARASSAVEAPFIVYRHGYYYLFASFDFCCRGAQSSYRVVVGRSRRVLGPYADSEGTPMLQGGGTSVLRGDTRWKGPGHNALLLGEERDYIVYHAYDANAGGAPTLRISELAWESDGWPTAAGP